MKLPQPLYEILRWFTWTVLPETAALIAGLNAAWGWGLPIEAILTTFSLLETFIGIVLGIAKYTNDKEKALK